MKATVIKAVWYWNKDRLKDQWNRIESRNDLRIWSIFLTNGENIYGKDHFWANGAGTIRVICQKKKEKKKNLDPYHATYAKINLKWITDLN